MASTFTFDELRASTDDRTIYIVIAHGLISGIGTRPEIVAMVDDGIYPAETLRLRAAKAA